MEQFNERRATYTNWIDGIYEDFHSVPNFKIYEYGGVEWSNKLDKAWDKLDKALFEFQRLIHCAKNYR